MIFESGHVKRFEMKDAGNSRLLEVTVSVRKWDNRKKERFTEYWKVTMWGKRGESLAGLLSEGDCVAFAGEQSIEPAIYKGEPRAWLSCNAQSINVLRPYENGGSYGKSPARQAAPSARALARRAAHAPPAACRRVRRSRASTSRTRSPR